MTSALRYIAGEAFPAAVEFSRASWGVVEQFEPSPKRPNIPVIQQPQQQALHDSPFNDDDVQVIVPATQQRRSSVSPSAQRNDGASSTTDDMIGIPQFYKESFEIITVNRRFINSSNQVTVCS